MRSLVSAVALGAFILALVACGTGTRSSGDASGDGDAAVDAGCPQDLPAACPASVPSFAATIDPLIESRCYPCHDKGGVGAGNGNEFTSYASIYDHRSGILNQVYSCSMPQPGAPPLTSDERAALLGWLVCHAPNN